MAEKNTDTIDNFIEVMNKAQDSTRLAIAQQLKDAGFYKGKVSGKFNIKFYTALKTLGAELTLQRKFNQQFGQPDISVVDYIAQRAAEGTTNQTGASGSDFNRVTIFDPTQAASVINAVYSDLMGRKASSEELKKYTTALQRAQRSNPVKYTNAAGAGYTATGGIDPQQFLTQQISGTAEAKTNRATDAYAIMMQELGGLR